MDDQQQAKFSERMKQMVAVLAAAILDGGGELTVSAERLAEVRARIEAGEAIQFQFSDDGRSVRVARLPE